MNIEKNEIRVMFANLDVGEVFECDGWVYMKTDSLSLDWADYINCVRLSDGRFGWFELTETVLHLPNAKVVI